MVKTVELPPHEHIRHLGDELKVIADACRQLREALGTPKDIEIGVTGQYRSNLLEMLPLAINGADESVWDRRAFKKSLAPFTAAFSQREYSGLRRPAFAVSILNSVIQPGDAQRFRSWQFGASPTHIASDVPIEVLAGGLPYEGVSFPGLAKHLIEERQDFDETISASGLRILRPAIGEVAEIGRDHVYRDHANTTNAPIVQTTVRVM